MLMDICDLFWRVHLQVQSYLVMVAIDQRQNAYYGATYIRTKKYGFLPGQKKFVLFLISPWSRRKCPKKVRIFTAMEKIRTFSNIAMDMQEYMKFYRAYRKTKKYGFLPRREKFVLFPLQQDHAGNY